MDYHIKTDYRSMAPQKWYNTELNKDGLRISKNTMMNYKTPCKSNNSSEPFGFVYENDGRVTDNRRWLRTILNTPAQVGFDGTMNDVCKLNNKKYGGIYDNYSDIQNGQITYYVDSSIAQPFFEPIYILPSLVEKNIFVDPMGSRKPEYKKIPVASTFNDLKIDRESQDQIFYRENLMASQQGLHNRSSWTNRFIN